MIPLATLAPSVLGVAEAFARAFTKCPEAQVEAARNRAANRKQEARSKWLRKVGTASRALARADRRDDEAGATKAVLDLIALGIDPETIRKAADLGARIATEDTEGKE